MMAIQCPPPQRWGSFGGSGVSLISYPQMIYCALRFVPRTTGCWLCRFSFSFHSKIVTQQMEHRNVGTGCCCCSSVGKEAHTHNGGTHSPGICKGTGEDKKLMKQVTSLHSSGLPHSAPFALRSELAKLAVPMYDDVVHNAVHFIKLFELEKFGLPKLFAKRFAFFLFRWLFLFLDASRRQLALAFSEGES